MTHNESVERSVELFSASIIKAYERAVESNCKGAIMTLEMAIGQSKTAFRELMTGVDTMLRDWDTLTDDGKVIANAVFGCITDSMGLDN